MDVDYVNKDVLRDLQVCLLISEVGGCSKKYRGEQRQGFKKLISEIYSPSREAEAFKRMPGHGIVPGFALDLTTANEEGAHWD